MGQTMSTHPANLTVRFLLELAALASLASWGWTLTAGAGRWALAIVVPLLFVVAWGTFNVPGDPSRSGGAVVAVPGVLRLLVELATFGSATGALLLVGGPGWAAAFGGVVAIHYALSWDRIAWLLRR